MTIIKALPMVPDALLYKRTIFCRYDEEPSTYSDLIYRGTLLWLREQAKQAENDPDREWLGFDHEFKLLQSGNHPDPHPERIILGKDTDNFDPSRLEDPKIEIRLSDNQGFNGVTSDAMARRHGYPRNSQQFLAHLCRKELDIFLGIKEDD